MATSVLAPPTPAPPAPTERLSTSDDSPTNRRILILTAEIGAGHISAANALKDQLELEDPTAHVVFDEPIARVPVLSRLPRIYRFMIAYLPLIWALFYYSRKIASLRSLYGRLMRRRLRPAISQIPLAEYDSVVITYSMYCNCIDTFTKVGLHTTVLVTDMFGGPHEWFIPGAHTYIVPTAHMEQMAMSCGIEQARILRQRLPTLATHLPRRRAWTANRRSTLSILVIGGSEGLGPLKEVTDGLLLSKRPVSVTVVCGDNIRLRKRFQRSQRGLQDQLTVMGFVPSVALTYSDYDFVVTKPGSVTLMELLHQDVPFLLLPGIPGIEAGNTRIFTQSSLPFVDNRDAARLTIDDLVNKDLSLSATGEAWTTMLSTTSDTLPTRSITVNEVSPPRHQRSGALTAVPA